MVDGKEKEPAQRSEELVIKALHLGDWDARVIGWFARNGITMMRLALGIIFCWFGVQKYFPGLSPAEGLAGQTILTLTFGRLHPAQSLPILATWECAIGLGLLSGRMPRLTFILLFGQMMGTALPLFFFPAETWAHFPYAPTMEGQYIIKNMVLVTSAMVVGATARGGRLVANARAARLAERAEP